VEDAVACLHSKTLVHNDTGALFLTRRVIGLYVDFARYRREVRGCYRLRRGAGASRGTLGSGRLSAYPENAESQLGALSQLPSVEKCMQGVVSALSCVAGQVAVLRGSSQLMQVHVAPSALDSPNETTAVGTALCAAI
jgi:hypothetical protein